MNELIENNTGTWPEISARESDDQLKESAALIRMVIVAYKNGIRTAQAAAGKRP